MEDQQKPAAGVNEGDVLAGKYRIDKVLGVGGMGVVVAAHHIQLDEKVAIKFLLPQALASKETVARFAREARAAVKIKSEHVARVSDVGTLDNGAPYMVMEYLQGGDLSEWLKQRGAMPIDLAVEFVLQACEAIAEAHALGIVHRDLKPSNLFATRRADGSNTVKVLDFGISKTGKDTAGMQMTATSSVMGSPLYMSPEQLQSSKDVDARSDIWSIGIILHELLTGDSPFQAETMPQLVVGIMSSPPPPLRNKRPEAPRGLELVILKCLDKDRGKRYQTIGDLAVALLEFAPKRSKISVERITGVMREAGLSSSTLAVPSSSNSEGPESTGSKASWGRTDTGIPMSGSKKPIFIGLGAVVVALLVAGVVVQMRQGGPSPIDSASSASPGTSATATAEPAQSAAPPSPTPEPEPAVSAAPPIPSSDTPKDRPLVAPRPAVPATTPGKPGKPARPAPSAGRPSSSPAQPESTGNSWGGRL
jgi:eukaryotic-like serine/threonine-protein kinase